MNIKIKTILLVSVLIFTVIPLIVVAIFSISNLVNYSHNKTDDAANAAVKSKYSAVNYYFESTTEELKSLGELEAVKNVTSDKKSAQTALSQYMSGNDALDYIFTDNSGNVLFSISGNVEEASVFSAFTDDVNQDAYISPLQTDGNYYSENVLYIAVKVQDSGYLWKAVSANHIMNVLSDTEFSKDGFISLIDKNGNIINFNEQVVKYDDISEKGIKDNVKELKVEDINDTSMTEKDAGSYHLYYRPLTFSPDWILSAIVTKSALNEYSKSAIINTSSVVVICLILCLLIGFIVVRSITKPMNSMIKTMKDILHSEKGEDIRFNIKSRNDFKAISESFNNLLDEVSLSQERHKTVADISNSILFEWDFQKEMMYVSDNFKNRFDIDITNATLQNGRFIDSLMESEFADTYKRDMTLLIKNKNAFSNEYQAKASSGEYEWISLRAECVTDRLGEILRVIGVITDIDKEKNMEIKLSERASYDFLSQLYNRNTFERVFVKELERRGMNKVAILFVDLDDFKFINDRYGHSVGDEVIKYVSDVIRSKVEGRDGFAGRFGGDEYVMCITNKDDINNIEYLSQEIIDKLYTGYRASTGVMINILCSIGIAICPEHGETAAELIKHADAAMYFVKKNGKSNYHIYVESDTESSDNYY